MPPGFLRHKNSRFRSHLAKRIKNQQHHDTITRTINCQRNRLPGEAGPISQAPEPHLPLLCDPRLQRGQEELLVEAVDGGDVREDSCGDFQRDPCFCQLGAEDLGTQWSLRVVTWCSHASPMGVGAQDRL